MTHCCAYIPLNQIKLSNRVINQYQFAYQIFICELTATQVCIALDNKADNIRNLDQSR